MDKQVITIDDSGDEVALKAGQQSVQETDQHPGENFFRNAVQDQYNPSSKVADIKPEFGFGLPTTTILDSQDEIRKMAELGLPTQFQQLGPEFPYHKEFFCETCHVQMTTEQAMEAHLSGTQHLKTALNKELFEKGKVKSGGPIDYIKFEDHERKYEPKKKPKRLGEKLVDVKQAYAGLKYIQEIMSVTKADKDPHYICQLCNCVGDAEIMFNHLLGRDHQETFIKTLSTLDVNLVNLQEETEKVKDNGKLELLVTIYSDELMPWPEGMAPWSVEQGGIGVPPTSVERRRRKQKNTNVTAPTKKVEMHAQGLPEIKSYRALSASYEAVSHLLDEALKFHKDHVKDPNDVASMKLVHAMAQANLAQLSGIKTSR